MAILVQLTNGTNNINKNPCSLTLPLVYSEFRLGVASRTVDFVYDL